jgi:antitoxin ParD1/3/4
MQSMNISLPESLKEFVDRHIATGRFSSASEYVRELIRAEAGGMSDKQAEMTYNELMRSYSTLAPKAADMLLKDLRKILAQVRG